MEQVIFLTLLAVSLEENEISVKPVIKRALLLAVVLVVKLKACELRVKWECLIVADVVLVL